MYSRIYGGIATMVIISKYRLEYNKEKIFLVISEEDTICPECGSPLCRRDRKLNEFVTTSENGIETAHGIFNNINIEDQRKADSHL